MRDMYKQLTTEAHMELCPVCGAKPELWRYSESDTAPTAKAVMCTTGETIGPQDGTANEGCLLYMPPNSFYCATEREAVKYWNAFATALTALQRKNRWAESQVLRAAEPEGGTHA